MAIQVPGNSKRTFYKILQISDDADADAIAAAYQRLKPKYSDPNDSAARNELLFIEHAYQTLSDPNSRSQYDKQVASTAVRPIVQYDYETSDESWFTGSKLLVVMVGVLATIAYGLSTRHSEETGKIDASKEAVAEIADVAPSGTEGSVQTPGKAIDRSAEIAQRQLDIQQQMADVRRMEIENRIRANNEEAAMRQAQARKAAEEREERCRYMRSLITQANNAGLYAEARALQARGCN